MLGSYLGMRRNELLSRRQKGFADPLGYRRFRVFVGYLADGGDVTAAAKERHQAPLPSLSSSTFNVGERNVVL